MCVDGNHLVLTASSSYAYLRQSFTTVIGRTYRVNAQSNGGDASTCYTDIYSCGIANEDYLFNIEVSVLIDFESTL